MGPFNDAAEGVVDVVVLACLRTDARVVLLRSAAEASGRAGPQSKAARSGMVIARRMGVVRRLVLMGG